MISAQDQTLSQLIAPLRRYSSTGEVNFEVQDKAGKMAEVEHTFAGAGAKIDKIDGVTVEFDDWWCNVRPSNTEPLLRLNLEANTPELMKEKFEQLGAMLGKPVGH